MPRSGVRSPSAPPGSPVQNRLFSPVAGSAVISAAWHEGWQQLRQLRRSMAVHSGAFGPRSPAPPKIFPILMSPHGGDRFAECKRRVRHHLWPGFPTARTTPIVGWVTRKPRGSLPWPPQGEPAMESIPGKDDSGLMRPGSGQPELLALPGPVSREAGEIGDAEPARQTVRYRRLNDVRREECQ
jgi:hypothetical protein